MKKRVLSIFLAIACLGAVMSSLVSCANKSGSAGGADTAGTAQTEDVITGGQSETQAADSTETATETATEAVTEAVTESNTLSLNMDLIADYGLTYDELKEKYGKVTHYAAFEGGTYFKFERGYGYYCCGDVNHITDWIYDENVLNQTGLREHYYPVIDGDTTCYSIVEINVGDLIKGSYTTLSVYDIASIPGINYVKTIESDFEPGVYSSTFTYDGFWHEHVTQIFIIGPKDEISSTSDLKIRTWAPYH